MWSRPGEQMCRFPGFRLPIACICFQWVNAIHSCQKGSHRHGPDVGCFPDTGELGREGAESKKCGSGNRPSQKSKLQSLFTHQSVDRPQRLYFIIVGNRSNLHVHGREPWYRRTRLRHWNVCVCMRMDQCDKETIKASFKCLEIEMIHSKCGFVCGNATCGKHYIA